MVFGLNKLASSKEEFLSNLGMDINNKRTLIFIDTNIFAELYRLHSSARLDFFNWADKLIAERRLKIPAWSASEYLAKVKARNLKDYFPNPEVDKIKAKLDTLMQTASMFVDDELLKKCGIQKGKDEYMRDSLACIDTLKNHFKVFNSQFDADVIHEEIQNRLSNAVLNSNIAKLCSRALSEGPGRVEHRLPPAFQDDSKKVNRFGDLIIWFEILEYSGQNKGDFDKVIFVTNDEKSDWVYAPKQRRKDTATDAKYIPNTTPTLKLVDPILVSEFKNVIGAHSEIQICTLLSLVEGVSMSTPEDFTQLAAAIQINTNAFTNSSANTTAVATNSKDEEIPKVENLPSATDNSNEQIGSLIDSPTNVGLQDSVLNYSQQALQDSIYKLDATLEIDKVIEALRAHDWYVQNPAISKIHKLFHETYDRDAWFVLGRNIYQASSGNAFKAVDFIINLHWQFESVENLIANHVLAGIVFEIYFDSKGELRATPNADLIEPPLQLVTTPEFIEVKNFILRELNENNAKLPFMPGDADIKVTFTTELIENFDVESSYKIVSILFNEHELVEGVDMNDENSWFTIFQRKFRIDDFIHYFSRKLAVPRWAIQKEFFPQLGPDAVLITPEDKYIDLDLKKLNGTNYQ